MPASNRKKAIKTANQAIINDNLWIKILIGLILGILAGFWLSPLAGGGFTVQQADKYGEWIALPGVIFLGLLQMVVVPLIICSIITGIADSGSMEFVKKIGGRAILYFIATTCIAITIGMLITNWVQPGANVDPALIENALGNGSIDATNSVQTLEDLTIPKRIANMIPTNFTKAQFEKNMLQIVIGSILAGLAMLGLSKPSVAPVLNLCKAGQILTMRIIGWAMKIAPYAVFGLMAQIVIQLGFEAITSVGLYVACVLGGLLAMGLVYMVIVSVFGGLSPLAFLRGIREAQIIAFSTSSSAATMPISIAVAEEKLKMRPEIVRFTIPLGATINMDGTALYQAVAALFLTQVFQVDLSFNEMVLLLVTTVGASIGTPALPGVGIVVLATILLGIGVPAEGIALILGVDRLLDMCRTTINVTGDLTATAVMQKWIKK